MNHYIHHVRGRLRVRTAVLKRNERRADSARRELNETNGVQRVEISTVTGSLLVYYDPAATDLHTLLNEMRSMGLLHGHVAKAPVTTSAAVGKLPVEQITDTIFSKIVETAIERSAMALVAALV
jgi:hypothetical protein